MSAESLNSQHAKGILTTLAKSDERTAKRALLRLRPSVLGPLDQRPHSLIQWSGHAILLAPLHDRAIHEIDLGDARRKHVLEHAGLVLTGSISPLLHQRARISVKRNAHRLG